MYAYMRQDECHSKSQEQSAELDEGRVGLGAGKEMFKNGSRDRNREQNREIGRTSLPGDELVRLGRQGEVAHVTGQLGVRVRQKRARDDDHDQGEQVLAGAQELRRDLERESRGLGPEPGAGGKRRRLTRKTGRTSMRAPPQRQTGVQLAPKVNAETATDTMTMAT